MAKDPEKDRSARLLSKEALPTIDIPRTAPPAVPQFMLPKAASGPVKVPDAPPPPKPPAEEPVKIEGRKRRASTGKFKDRTLGWFAIGDQLAEQKPEVDDEPPEPERSRGPMLAIALGAAAVLTLVVIWLVLR